MGGIERRLSQSQNDVFVFDTENKQVQQVAEGGELTFSSRNNASVAVSNEKVMALVISGKDF